MLQATMKLSLLLTKEAVEMPKLYFVTDLDRTIIHSKHPDYYCVESIGQKEVTRIALKSTVDFCSVYDAKSFPNAAYSVS